MNRTLSNLLGTKITEFWVNKARFIASGLSANRDITIPNKSGTLAMLDDVGAGTAVSTTQTVDFGSTFTDKAELVVTGQSWVTVNSEIVPQIKVPSGVDADEIRLLELKPEISNLVNGTGFTLTVYSEPEATGTYDVMCIGV
jgi:hypothetical protein